MNKRRYASYLMDNMQSLLQNKWKYIYKLTLIGTCRLSGPFWIVFFSCLWWICNKVLFPVASVCLQPTKSTQYNHVYSPWIMRLVLVIWRLDTKTGDATIQLGWHKRLSQKTNRGISVCNPMICYTQANIFIYVCGTRRHEHILVIEYPIHVIPD